MSTIINTDHKARNEENTIYTTQHCSVILRDRAVGLGHCRIKPTDKTVSFRTTDLDLKAEIEECRQALEKRIMAAFGIKNFLFIQEGKEAIEGTQCKQGCFHLIPVYDTPITCDNLEFAPVSNEDRQNMKASMTLTQAQLEMIKKRLLA